MMVKGNSDVILCFAFASLTILFLGFVLFLFASGKILPGNAIQAAVTHTIKEVFGRPD